MQRLQSFLSVSTELSPFCFNQDGGDPEADKSRLLARQKREKNVKLKAAGIPVFSAAVKDEMPTMEKKPTPQDVLRSTLGRELNQVEMAAVSLAKDLAIKGAGEKQALHGLCLIVGDGAEVLKCGDVKKKSQDFFNRRKVSVLEDDAGEFSDVELNDSALASLLGMGGAQQQESQIGS